MAGSECWKRDGPGPGAGACRANTNNQHQPARSDCHTTIRQHHASLSSPAQDVVALPSTAQWVERPKVGQDPGMGREKAGLARTACSSLFIWGTELEQEQSNNTPDGNTHRTVVNSKAIPQIPCWVMSRLLDRISQRKGMGTEKGPLAWRNRGARGIENGKWTERKGFHAAEHRGQHQ